MTFKQSQGHPTYYENVDPAQGYNHAKFKRSRFDSVHEKGIKAFLRLGNVSILSLEPM